MEKTEEQKEILEQENCNCKEEQECQCKQEKKKKKQNEKEEILHLKQEIQTLNDSLLKEKAELINYRKRKEEETMRMLKYANEDLAKEMLVVVDNFERAILMDDDNLEDEVSKFLAGFKMIYCNMVNILEHYGIKAIDGANKAFDPTYHQAVLTEKVEGTEPGMVLEVLQKGYLLKDKVIRPAMVQVSE